MPTRYTRCTRQRRAYRHTQCDPVRHRDLNGWQHHHRARTRIVPSGEKATCQAQVGDRGAKCEGVVEQQSDVGVH
jgi:hypothetical protein